MPRTTPYNMPAPVMATIISNHIIANPGLTRDELIAALNITQSQFITGWAYVRQALNKNHTRTYRIETVIDPSYANGAKWVYFIENTVESITTTAAETVEFVSDQMRGIQTRIVRLDNGTMAALADIIGTKKVKRVQRRLESLHDDIDDLMDDARKAVKGLAYTGG